MREISLMDRGARDSKVRVLSWAMTSWMRLAFPAEMLYCWASWARSSSTVTVWVRMAPDWKAPEMVVVSSFWSWVAVSASAFSTDTRMAFSSSSRYSFRSEEHTFELQSRFD